MDFTVRPSNLTIPSGQIAVFECESGDSYPAVSISWYKMMGNSPVNVLDIGDPRYNISSINTLYIRVAAASDAGTYLCVASNMVGSMTATAELMVISYPPMQQNRK